MAHYQITYNVHLPADPGYREINRNKKRVATAQTPLSAFQLVVKDMAEILGFQADPHLLAGCLLETVNRFPEDVRKAVAAGIIDGLGLTIELNGTDLEARMEKKFDSLTVSGEKTTASGLIIPGQ